jgi:hypothetical protein
MTLDQIQVVAFQVLTVLTLVMPALEYIAGKTATKVDDEILDKVKALLAMVPRVRLGGDKK